MARTSKFTTGSQFGPYRIVKSIGEGGMGEVFEAVEEPTGRHLALKLISAEHSESPERVARFISEAKALAQINHPNVVAMYAFGEIENQYYMAMELIRGISLATFITSAAYGIDEIVSLFRQIAEGVQAAHLKGILHRDLKPSNILVDSEGRVHIIDFGIAKLTTDKSANQTETGAFLGTPTYLAPEVVIGKGHSHLSDIYGLGVILYELLVGTPPFVGKNVMETLEMIRKKPVRFPQRLDVRLPGVFKRFINILLAKNPQDRFPTIAHLLVELARIRPEAFPEELKLKHKRARFIKNIDFVSSYLAQKKLNASDIRVVVGIAAGYQAELDARSDKTLLPEDASATELSESALESAVRTYSAALALNRPSPSTEITIDSPPSKPRRHLVWAALGSLVWIAIAVYGAKRLWDSSPSVATSKPQELTRSIAKPRLPAKAEPEPQPQPQPQKLPARPSEPPGNGNEFDHVGSNYFAYDLESYWMNPTKDNWNNPAVSHFVIPDFPVGQKTIEAQLRLHCQSGQRIISLPIWFANFNDRVPPIDHLGHILNVKSGLLSPDYANHLTEFLKLVANVKDRDGNPCFREVQIRFSPQESSDPRSWLEFDGNSYLLNFTFMKSVRSIVEEALGQTSMIRVYDLGMGLGGVWVGNSNYRAVRQYTHSLWQDYVHEFGGKDSCGFSTVLESGRLAAQNEIYGLTGKFPLEFWFIAPTVQSFNLAERELASVSQLSQTIVIQDVPCNDKQFMDRIAILRQADGLKVRSVIQWPSAAGEGDKVASMTICPKTESANVLFNTRLNLTYPEILGAGTRCASGPCLWISANNLTADSQVIVTSIHDSNTVLATLRSSDLHFLWKPPTVYFQPPDRLESPLRREGLKFYILNPQENKRSPKAIIYKRGEEPKLED